mmetsp:Transcript_9948/g.21358  ORF Transcript_9948/g.21358 Transcript_9948/m.21358 type:complete len:233 (-) Transcript_9948:200-898(-)
MCSRPCGIPAQPRTRRLWWPRSTPTKTCFIPISKRTSFYGSRNHPPFPTFQKSTLRSDPVRAQSLFRRHVPLQDGRFVGAHRTAVVQAKDRPVGTGICGGLAPHSERAPQDAEIHPGKLLIRALAQRHAPRSAQPQLLLGRRCHGYYFWLEHGRCVRPHCRDPDPPPQRARASLSAGSQNQHVGGTHLGVRLRRVHDRQARQGDDKILLRLGTTGARRNKSAQRQRHPPRSR